VTWATRARPIKLPEGGDAGQNAPDLSKAGAGASMRRLGSSPWFDEGASRICGCSTRIGRIVTAAAVFGHTRARMTRLSPASISDCAISIPAVIRELVTRTRSGSIGPRQVIGDACCARFGKSRFAGIKGMPGLRGCGRGGPNKAGVDRSPWPYHSGTPCGPPIPAAKTLVIRETGSFANDVAHPRRKLLLC
jgi:hypothetical protein